MRSTLALCGVAWWFGLVRHRAVVLTHAGHAAIAAASWLMIKKTAPAVAVEPAVVDVVVASRSMSINLLLASAAYLAGVSILRRAGFEAVAALGVSLVAISLAVRDADAASPTTMLVGGMISGYKRKLSATRVIAYDVDPDPQATTCRE